MGSGSQIWFFCFRPEYPGIMHAYENKARENTQILLQVIIGYWLKAAIISASFSEYLVCLVP